MTKSTSATRCCSAANCKVRAQGITLIETLVTLAILAVLLAVTAPSAIEWIAVQRVRSAATEMVSDVQFARGESLRRNSGVALTFSADANQSCYVIHTTTLTDTCDCLKGAGQACTDGGNNPIANLNELKLVTLSKASQVTATPISTVKFGGPKALPVRPSSGSPTDPVPLLDVLIDGQSNRTLKVKTNATGRPQVCAPPASKMLGYEACN